MKRLSVLLLPLLFTSCLATGAALTEQDAAWKEYEEVLHNLTSTQVDIDAAQVKLEESTGRTLEAIKSDLESIQSSTTDPGSWFGYGQQEEMGVFSLAALFGLNYWRNRTRKEQLKAAKEG